MFSLQTLNPSIRPLCVVRSNTETLLEWALLCMQKAPTEMPNPRRHAPAFFELMLEAANTPEDFRALAKRYTQKDPAYTTTKQGLGAIALEMAVVKTGGKLVDAFVETIVDESATFQAVFIGKLHEQDLEKLTRLLSGKIEMKPILEYGTVDPKIQTMNEFTVFECTAKDLKNGKPANDFQGFPASGYEYEQVRESGGVAQHLLMRIHEFKSIEPGHMLDANGVSWEPLGSNYAPVDHDFVMLEVFDYVVKGQPDNRSSISATLTKWRELGIQRIPISEFAASFKDNFYAASDRRKIDDLKSRLQESRIVTPLIAVKDSEGYYILEGGHRLVALFELKAKDIPALVVEDLDESSERCRNGVTVKQESVQQGPATVRTTLVTLGKEQFSVPCRPAEVLARGSAPAIHEFVLAHGSLVARINDVLEEAPKDEPEGDDRMDSPEFYRDDVQSYYDALVLLGLEPEECEKKTKDKFDLSKLVVTPTGEVRSPGVVDRPASQELPPVIPPVAAAGGAGAVPAGDEMDPTGNAAPVKENIEIDEALSDADKLATLLGIIEKGGTVTFTTPLKSWKIDKKVVDKFAKAGMPVLKVGKDGNLMMAQGKNYVDVSRTAIKAYAPQGTEVPKGMSVTEALSDQAAKDALVGGKAVLIDDCWFEIASRDLDADKVTLIQSEYALRDGFPKCGPKTVSFSELVKNVASGKWSANINGKWHGPKQDPAVRDKYRKAKGLPAAPGSADLRKDEGSTATAPDPSSKLVASINKDAPLTAEDRKKIVGAEGPKEKAESGMAWVVHWADGRAVCAFSKRSEMLAWAERRGNLAEIVSVKYSKPEFKGKPVRVSTCESLDEGIRTRYICPKCDSSDVAMYEAHADTGMDCMRLRCRACRYSADLDEDKFKSEDYEDPNYKTIEQMSQEEFLNALRGRKTRTDEAIDETPPGTVLKMCASADKGPGEAKRIWKHATDAASEKFETGSDDWWAYAMGVVKKACSND